jgi:hypothetical protein
MTVRSRIQLFLGKCIFKLLTQNGVWQTLFKIKYIGSCALSQVYLKPGHLCFRDGLMEMNTKLLPIRFIHNEG